MGIYDRNYYRDENDLDLRPSWDQGSAVSTLIIINVAVFVANIFLTKSFAGGGQGLVNEFLMLTGGDIYRPYYWWHTLTYGFCHDAQGSMPGSMPVHLIMNMLGLYFLGRSVEERYGRIEFYRIYLISMLICGWIWLLKQFAFQADGGLLGASGAVLCIEMLFVFNFPTSRVYLLVFPIPAWVLGILLVLMNLASSPSTGVATDVHMTGILCATGYFFTGMSFRFLGDFKGSWRRWSRKFGASRLRLHEESSTFSGSFAEEADRILAKIHESGQESLTAKEKKILERYSRSVRESKQKI